jgi:hypothetical protein
MEYNFNLKKNRYINFYLYLWEVISKIFSREQKYAFRERKKPNTINNSAHTFNWKRNQIKMTNADLQNQHRMYINYNLSSL